MDARIIVMAWSFILLLALIFYGRLKEATVHEFLLSALFIVSPLLIFGSAQQLIYISDFVGLFAGYQVLQFLMYKKGMKRVWDSYDWVVLVLLIISPVVTLTFQLIFNFEEVSLPHGLTFLLRSWSTFLIYFWIRLSVRNNVLVFNGIGRLVIFPIALMLFFACSQYFTNISTDIYEILGETMNITQWNGGFGGGAAGLYRGEVGAMAALFSVVGVSTLSRDTIIRWSAPLIIAVCLYLCTAVGSRQGTVGVLFFSVIYWVVNVQRGRVIDANYLLGVVSIFSIFAIVYLLYSTNEFSYWVLSRFEVFSSGVDDLLTAAEARDTRMEDIGYKFLSDPFVYVFGIGSAAFSEFISFNPWIMIYVDSEFYWTLQQNGLLGILCLFFIYSAWASDLLKGWKSKNVGPAELIFGFSLILIYLFFTYGHYVFLNFQSSNSQFAALSWALFAISIQMMRNRNEK